MVDVQLLRPFEELGRDQGNLGKINISSRIRLFAGQASFLIYSSELQNLWIFQKGQHESRHPETEPIEEQNLLLVLKRSCLLFFDALDAMGKDTVFATHKARVLFRVVHYAKF